MLPLRRRGSTPRASSAQAYRAAAAKAFLWVMKASACACLDCAVLLCGVQMGAWSGSCRRETRGWLDPPRRYPLRYRHLPVAVSGFARGASASPEPHSELAAFLTMSSSLETYLEEARHSPQRS